MTQINNLHDAAEKMLKHLCEIGPICIIELCHWIFFFFTFFSWIHKGILSYIFKRNELPVSTAWPNIYTTAMNGSKYTSMSYKFTNDNSKKKRS